VRDIFDIYSYVHVCVSVWVCVCVYVCLCVSLSVYMWVCVYICRYIDICRDMDWLRLVGFLKLLVSFAEYGLFYRALLQKRPIILRSLLIVATLYIDHLGVFVCVCVCVWVGVGEQKCGRVWGLGWG